MTVEKRIIDRSFSKVALYLFQFGATVVFISGLLALLNINNSGDIHLGKDAWIFPIWGGVAILNSLILKNVNSEIAKSFGQIWLVIGLALLALVVFGATISFT